MKVVLTDAAAADLEAIEDYIAQDDPARAVSFAEELLDQCEGLAGRAEAFPLVERYARQDIRRRPYGRYLIFYRVRSNTIEVIHILHGARDYAPILEAGF